MPKTLANWLTYLETLHPKTVALGLERVMQVRRRLQLHPDFAIITVGGTNGKGSVCAMLESMLHAAGYKVGCYTSPHLLRYNERVRIAHRQASDEELCAAFEKIEEARSGVSARTVEESSRAILDARSRATSDQACPSDRRADRRGTSEQATQQIDGAADCSAVPLTYFEFGTLAAIQCFIEQQVEVAILEVGLGGRLDAVNAFDCDCAVIASVDIDHTDYLGDTREAIAYEKAGIMRGGKVAVCADPDTPLAVIDHARKIGAELWRIGQEFGYVPHHGQWDYHSAAGTRVALPYPALRGAYQLENASAALAALDAMKHRLPVNMQAVRRGLSEVQLAGRFQFVPGRPTMILDVAHNPHAARALAQNLAGLPPCRQTFAVFAMLKDKDIAGVVSALDPHIDIWMAAGLAAPRGAAPETLERVLEQSRVRGEIRIFGNIAEALGVACNAAGENDRIIIFGSFYTVAEAMVAKGLSVDR